MAVQPQTGGVSLSDLLTALKNAVTAVSSLAQTYLNVQGAQNFAGITVPTVIKTSSGRIAMISVTVAGSAPGMAYDAAILGATTKPLCVIPNTTGLFVVNMPTSFGLLIVPGTGQTVSGSFS